MGVLEKITSNQELRSWPGEIPLENLYTMGLAGERFFRGIKDEAKLLGTRCKTCDVTYLPPRIYCQGCFEKLVNWVDLPPQGKLETFTILNQDRAGRPYKTPRILGLVRIDRSEGALIHYIQGLEPQKIRIGMKLKAQFRSSSERKGSIQDIVGFVPA
ncbi:MAG: Zn-ribbon domain-containing OB-fold protein [Deltaproteobacteria bacterium]|nr:Zn-ribbon domain-containing OB-fold protein [Deltaproteobacteria bacterium]